MSRYSDLLKNIENIETQKRRKEPNMKKYCEYLKEFLRVQHHNIIPHEVLHTLYGTDHEPVPSFPHTTELPSVYLNEVQVNNFDKVYKFMTKYCD